MEEGSVAHNCAASPVSGAVMTHVEAQRTLAELINKISLTLACCWWQLLGDEPNSLCRLLDTSWSDFRQILRICRVLCGPADSFRTSVFEEFMLLAKKDYTIYRPTGKPIYFLKIGDRIDDPHSVEKPKSACSVGGALELVPISGTHVPGIRTKVSRCLSSSLIAATAQFSTDGKTPQKESEDNQNNKGSMTVYINDLIDVVRKETLHASRQGKSYTFTQRAERQLRKAAVVAIKNSLQDAFDAWVERIGNGEKGKEVAVECTSTPEVSSQMHRPALQEADLANITRPALFDSPLDQSAPVITPATDLSDDVDVDESDMDLVLTELKEVTILQNLLHKRLTSKQERVLTLEHRNGRKFRVLIPPESQTSKTFVEEAKKSRWITQLLHNEQHRKGMLLYLAQHHPATYVRVANQRKVTIQSAVLNTPQTVALGRLPGINNTQMTMLRSYLRTVGKCELKMSKKELMRIDKDVGLDKTMPDVHFDTYTLEWASTSGKSGEKKPPETCPHWNSNLLLEVAAEIDLVLTSLFLEKPDNITVPSLDYGAPGFNINSPGIVVLFGGDHGAGACPCSLKLNFSSPEERKARGELNWRCPTMQIASIDCSKDSFELLSNTVMPRLRRQLIDLKDSCAIVVYCRKEPRALRKAILVPKTFERASTCINTHFLIYQVGAEERSIDLHNYFDNDAASFDDFRVTVVISNFHDLYVGDLAFLCMAVGMNHSDGAHCAHCTTKARDFNVQQIEADQIRTRASLTPCLIEFNRQKERRKDVRNYKGVNCVGLLDIDPQRIIVPVLHCPMGLVDKVLAHFKAWTIYDVEKLPETSDAMRQTYRRAIEEVATAVQQEEEGRRLDNLAGHTAESMALFRLATAARMAANKVETKAKKQFDDMVKKHNSRLFSLAQNFDEIFRSHNIKKEHYHGGKYNGVNCIRIMDKADLLFAEFSGAIKAKKLADKTDAEIDFRCNQHARMFGLLDAIWSSVRGIDAGLLPTGVQVAHLRKAVAEGKQLWLLMNIGTLQPKWHMTFDGHLVDQVIKYGGLADKADDAIEFQHQILMKLRDRFRSVTSFRKKETCIHRELRRRQSPEIQRQIDSYEAAIKRKPNRKRQRDATDRQQQHREAKKIKREAVVDAQCSSL